MLGGRLDHLAVTALRGGAPALEQVGLEPGRPLQPMLASTAASAAQAVRDLGLASVEWKLDGIRIQVHRSGDVVRVWTRNLNEITDRLPGVVAAVRSLPVDSAVLDGEAIAFGADGRPKLFQDTVRADVDDDDQGGLRPFFFDLVHLDGDDLIDRPLSERRAALHRVAGDWVIPSELTEDPAVAEAVLARALDAGHEGIVAKGAASTYDAGRRGTAWRKVKPVHTLDLVVLGAEWGHGRRTGWLSNLHLGARADDGTGVVMVGKTFKGLTDELLAWQTRRLCALAGLEPPDRASAPVGEVLVPPSLVVEIAVDGVQRSTRYPGGVALRFARVVRYRADKTPADADRISTVRAMLAGG
jgi:DNA ligase-1